LSTSIFEAAAVTHATIATPVIFRADKDGEVTAIFPCEPFDYEGRYMSCYAHIGQHGSCSLEWYRTTRPAAPDEYASLKRELESASREYRLKVYRRMTPGHRDAFNAAAMRKV
jgi:hypothetical protein